MSETSLRAQNLLVERVTEFVRYARDNDFDIGTGDLLDAQRMAASGYLTDRKHLFWGLRSILCCRQEDWSRFFDIYTAFWLLQDGEEESEQKEALPQDGSGTSSGGQAGASGFSGSSSIGQTSRGNVGASDYKTVSLADFRFVHDAAQMRAIEQWVDSLARKMRRRMLRRYRVSGMGQNVDLRQTLRRSLRYEGWPFDVRYRVRRRRLPNFVLLLDVSQSMEIYAKLFLRFAWGIIGAFDRSETFAFHTKLVHVGDCLGERDPQRLEQKLTDISTGWMGGTKIAGSLEDFNQNYLNRMVNPRTIVVIFSDGFDTATASELAEQVEIVQRKSKRLIWVNPLMGRYEEGYIDDRMEPVLPFVDGYASAHTLESLKLLEKELIKS